MRDHLAAQRDAPRQHEDQTSQRVDLFILVIAGKLDAGFSLDLVQGRAGLYQPLAGLLCHPKTAFNLVMFVLNLADDLFDQILDGHQAVHAAIFVDHQRHMRALLLHLLQQNADRHRGRNIKQRAKHRAKREFSAHPETMFQRQVFQVDQAKRAVQRAAKDGNARKPMFAKHLDHVLQRDIQRRGNDLGLGNGNVINPQAAQIDHPRRWLGGAALGMFGLFLILIRTAQGIQETSEEPASLR